tara:strand:- start:487 stop:684 length:198 start_codon:yes stop_codon:yes gene_type:complete
VSVVGLVDQRVAFIFRVAVAGPDAAEDRVHVPYEGVPESGVGLTLLVDQSLSRLRVDSRRQAEDE